MSPPYETALVIGLGKSGVAAAKLLLGLGVHVRGYDRRDEPGELPEGLEAFLGDAEVPKAAFTDIDVMVLSPGVPPTAFRERCHEYAPAAQIEGELGLALSLIPKESQPQLVLITGTNGKSTVTALTGALLAADGRDVFVGGNLGDPLADRVHASLCEGRPWPEAVVLECSSYQLETLPSLPTAVAMLLNVTPDHLDRYPSLEAYAETKQRVFAGLEPGGLALLDADCEWTPKLRPGRDGIQQIEIGRRDQAYVEGEGAGTALVLIGDESLPRETLRLPARHNAKNALFALAAARHLGVDEAARARGLAAFEGLPHRMRFVRELDNVRYYNDSKATNVASAVAGLGGLDERFVLIAGGLSKGDDLAPLRSLVLDRGRGLVAIGDARDEFHEIADGRVTAARAETMVEAVTVARAMARPGDVIVLAPACASFDQYRNYGERGDAFEAAVNAL